MTKTKVLITVKTYPNISSKYDELVCTAGFLEDGSMIRIFPIPFRKLDYDKQYAKYQWIELDLEKYTGDFRPESYTPTDRLFQNITPLEKLGTDNNWQERKDIVFKKGYYTNLTTLINEAKDPSNGKSLAVFKPTKILDFVIESVSDEYDERKIEKILNQRAQLSLFETYKDNCEDLFEIVKKLPYKFSYKFEDIEGREATLMIEDWEIGQLYWNCLKTYGNEEVALQKVEQKYRDDFINNKDLYFFMGTTQRWHNVSPNPFLIIGVFYPKYESQMKLQLV